MHPHPRGAPQLLLSQVTIFFADASFGLTDSDARELASRLVSGGPVAQLHFH